MVSLVPVATTFVGYMLGVPASGMQAAGISGEPFPLFLRTIPLNFFSYTAALVAIASIFVQRSFGTAGAPHPTEDRRRDVTRGMMHS